jgi:HPt (histidine-containing phosphotransfer) domain-containing protein
MHIDLNNLNMLKDILGNEFVDILNVFLETTPDYIVQLQEAASVKDIDKVKLISHSIKGSSANIGANQLSILGAELEQTAKNNDTEAFEDLITKIVDEANSVEADLQTYIQTF